MAPTRITVVEPDADADPALLERAYREVLALSFAPAELETADQLLPRLRAGGGDSYVAVALTDDAAPVGAMVADNSPESGVLLLTYLAVRSDVRGGGVGSALLKLLPAWRERAGADHVLAEVEDPRFHAAGPYGDPVARLVFYQRHGYTLVPLPFVQPRVRPDADRVGGLLLAVLGERPVPPATLRAFFTAYLREAEDLSAADDPTYARLLARLDRTGSLDPLPPDRYLEIEPLEAREER